jgi:hypothetical protein
MHLHTPFSFKSITRFKVFIESREGGTNENE